MLLSLFDQVYQLLLDYSSADRFHLHPGMRPDLLEARASLGVVGKHALNEVPELLGELFAFHLRPVFLEISLA